MVPRKINLSVESIMVILLLIIFAASVSVLIYEGSVTYRSITESKTEEENARIALSYINMLIRQNDLVDHIHVYNDSSLNRLVLKVDHHGDENGLISYIYELDGFLWECYTDGPLDHSLSLSIIPIHSFALAQDEVTRQITTTIVYKHKDSFIPLTQLTSLRSAPSLEGEAYEIIE